MCRIGVVVGGRGQERRIWERESLPPQPGWKIVREIEAMRLKSVLFYLK
jgi:hypothetical protein